MSARPLRYPQASRFLGAKGFASPLVSAIVPVYNGRATLTRALKSIERQTYCPLEVVIVDDGSVDDIEEVVAAFAHLKPKFERLASRLGVAIARNVGLAASSGEFIAFLDADDEWLAEKTALQVITLRDSPEFAFTHANAFLIVRGRDAGLVVESANVCAHGEHAWKALLKRGCVVTSSVMTRRSLMREVGGFNSSLPIAEDQDLWIRLALRGIVHHEAKPLIRKHSRRNSLTNLYRKLNSDVTLPMIEAYVAALADRLTSEETKDILGYRRLLAGRSSYESGSLVRGLQLVFSSLTFGGGVAQNLMYLGSASPLARVGKRVLGHSGLSAANALPAVFGDLDGPIFAVVLDITGMSNDGARLSKSLEALAAVFERYRVAPTLVVDECALAGVSNTVLKDFCKNTGGEIGTRSSGTQAPCDTMETTEQSYARTFRALKELTNEVTSQIGLRPFVHKTDRASGETSRALALRALGYEIDIRFHPLRNRTRNGKGMVIWHDGVASWIGEDYQLFEILATTDVPQRLGQLGAALLPNLNERVKWRANLIEGRSRIRHLRCATVMFGYAYDSRCIQRIVSLSKDTKSIFCLNIELSATDTSSYGHLNTEPREAKSDALGDVLQSFLQGARAKAVNLRELRQLSHQESFGHIPPDLQ